MAGESLEDYLTRVGASEDDVEAFLQDEVIRTDFEEFLTRLQALGPVAVWCRSFDSVMCSKGDESWAQSGRMNFARMRCGSR